ncbi:MAG: hypothetical protein Q9174_003348 [Haloplaca sp. 1 TL-2023]
MAPKKKNKKAISNPARGFATTSIASKAKLQAEEAAESPVPMDMPGVLSQDQPPVQNGAGAPEEKELKDFSPEQLENQLEESDLHIFLDKHNAKLKKDVDRQMSKLQTEKRILRPQAESLQIRPWLPSQMMETIMQTLANEKCLSHSTRRSPSGYVYDELSEDAFCIKIWTLRQVLVQLGFPFNLCQEALQDLLAMVQTSKVHESLAGKDNVWGLDYCLDWLALNCDSDKAPSYFSSSSGVKAAQLPEQQQTVTPSNFPSEDCSLEEDSSTPPKLNLEERTEERSLDVNSNHLPVQAESDEDSEVDPELMTDKYITMQTQLFDLLSDPSTTELHKPANGKGRPRNVAQKPVDPQVSRLLRRLERLKADILFDQHVADQRWTEKRNQLAKAAAERRRLHLDDKPQPEMKSPDPVGSSVAVSPTGDEVDGDPAVEDDVEALGDFFSGLPDFADSSNNGVVNQQANNTSHGPMTVRDFGKWNGVNPRRTFEETCKARYEASHPRYSGLCVYVWASTKISPRDSAVRITYQLLDRSPFTKQHSIAVRWSCDQPLPLLPPDESVLCTADRRDIRIEMHTEATPTAAQSEAYISTAALFLLFSSTPKEEKASLRLPPVWKDLWMRLAALKKSNDMAADRDELRRIRALIDESRIKERSSGDEADTKLMKSVTPAAESTLGSNSERLERSDPPDQLQTLWTSKSATQSYHRMLVQRMRLPIHGFREQILQAIDNHQVVIVCGETGCGKSTQVPSYVLEKELMRGKSCRIYCTEPRRISAISLARRVSEEIGERKGDIGTARSLVGYAIRLESKVSHQTRLVYATTGIVMRMLETSDELEQVTHLILDEVHERSIESDFLLIVLRKLLARRPGLKVILMSATVDADKFSAYFSGAPVMTVPGRTFPVETKFLEDALEETKFTNHASSDETPAIEDYDEDENLPSDKRKSGPTPLEGYSLKTRDTLAKLDEYRVNYGLIKSLLETIATSPKYESYSKAILVFLPGIAEIRRLNDILTNSFPSGWQIHALHSTIAMEEQERAFAIPPAGQRKIVLSTNIAETGVTIPDVTCVIDAGKHKEMRFDERRQLSRLIEVFISRANAKQRRGRAGRVQHGICFHLFTKARHDTTMAQEQTPEILRLSLQDLVLRVKICKLGSIEGTLAEALDAPSTKNIRRAIDALVDVKALTSLEDLTPLGRQLAKLPLDVFLGKLILLGCLFKCLDGALTIAAIMSSKSPFSAPMGARTQADQARLAFKKGDSDLLTVYNAYCAWRRVCNASGTSEQQFCRKNFLLPQNLSNIEELKAQLANSLVDAGFLELGPGERMSINRFASTAYNANDDDVFLNSIIAWSFYPKILKREGKSWRNIANNQTVGLYATSVNRNYDPPKWLSFYHIMQSSSKSLNAHETSAVDPFALILACGDADFKMNSGVIVIDGNRIRFAVDDWKTMLAIKTLRQKLRQVMAQCFRDPGFTISAQQQTWLDIWKHIFNTQAEKTINGKK